MIHAFGTHAFKNTHTHREKKKEGKRKRWGRGATLMGDNIAACNLAIHCISGILWYYISGGNFMHMDIMH